jgi:Cytokine-induced anti-apoptosis inhibitor 1, Fe-S biogenesis
MKMDIDTVTKKFCGEDDGIKPMKPCANCSCGLKEIYEAAEQANGQANVQPAESSCGKCYLGDAFRCAGCPYRGQPAFEPGDKLKLASISESATTSEGVKTAAGEKVVLEL